MRVLFTLQYLGTRYAGWQSQTNATAIQDVVNDALTRLYQTAIRVEGAGRTDSGVHAMAQRAHADVPFAIPQRGLILGANDLLPPDIRVIAAEEVAADFHCRFAAKSKTYVYRIWNAEVMDVFREETHAHVPGRMNEEAMMEVAKSLLGEHDFRAFTVAEPEVSSTVRTVSLAEVRRNGDAIEIHVAADGFLRYMVRRIAGSLIEIGRGKLSAEAFWSEARWTAPAKGLTLLGVRY